MKTFLWLLFMMTSTVVFAQFDNLLGTSSRDANKPPTQITADHFLLQGKQKMLSYEGNVKVDDTDVVLTCQKLTLFGKDKQADSNIVKKTVKQKEHDAGVDMMGFGSGGSVELDRIEFEEDLIIIRKQKNAKGEYEEIQRATAGKGIYYAQLGKFVLLDKPVVSQGKNALAGDELVVYRDTLEVTGKNVRTTVVMEQEKIKPTTTKTQKNSREDLYRLNNK